MELKAEWKGRIENWIHTVGDDVYAERLMLSSEAFITSKHLLYADAMKHEFAPIAPGTHFGKVFEYLWVRSTFIVPDELDGADLVMDLAVGGEACVWVNGEEFGCRRNEWVREPLHHICDLELTQHAKAGDVYDIVCEVYAGNPIPESFLRPILDGKRPENPDLDESIRATFGGIKIGTWDEAAYQLYLDVKFLNGCLSVMSEDELHYDKIRAALKRFSADVDFSLPKAERTASYIAARQKLASVMQAKNGTITPVMYAFGHAHIDVAWLWPLAETERKVLRTFAAQLRHMDRYPDYKFIQSQAQLYAYVKQYYPKMLERIREKVEAGQWIPEGGMWVEPDMNIASGESLIRQFIHGKRFFREELGYDSRMLWLPDVFGYNAALPEIMRGCDIDYFCTQKLTWAYNGGEPFPLNYFNWVGIDGTKIPAFIHGNYNLEADPASIANLWKHRKQHMDLDGFIMPFGYGDGGGGPCRSFIENIERAGDFQGLPKCESRHPNDYFIDHPEPELDYVGELYLQCHRGTLTSQALIKRNNRKCELALREAEYFGEIAKLNGLAYPLSDMDAMWKNVLLMQFHDILPGSSINRVYKDARAAHEAVLNGAGQVAASSLARLCNGDGITVANSLLFERHGLVRLPDGFNGAIDNNGNSLPLQEINGEKYVFVTLPSCGTLSLHNGPVMKSNKQVTAFITSDGAIMENSRIRVTFDNFGAITSIFDKDKAHELTHGKCNDLHMYRDDPIRYDAWDIDSTYEYCPVELSDPAEFSIEATDGFVARLHITRKISNSVFEQTAVLGLDKRMDFETHVDWHETHKLLKVNFAVDYVCDNAYNEIQFGYVKRPTHRSRQYDFDRFEVANYRYTALAESGRGFAIINDCKYGVNQLGNSINLTLLRSAIGPDTQCDLGEHMFTYGFVAYDGAFADAAVIRAAEDLNVPFTVCKGACDDRSYMSIAAPNILLSSLKPAEDGSNDYIVRLYEASGCGTRTVLNLNMPCSAVRACNLIERDLGEMDFNPQDSSVNIPLDFGAFEIKTLRITP